jgi:hypothetical protein
MVCVCDFTVVSGQGLRGVHHHRLIHTYYWKRQIVRELASLLQLARPFQLFRLNFGARALPAGARTYVRVQARHVAI